MGIKSFLRPHALERTLAGLMPFAFHSIVVADDGTIDERKGRLYEEASERMESAFKLLRLPFDTGLSAGRNAIVEMAETEYLLMLDDDQEVPANLMDLAEVLETDQEIGGVSCMWREYGRYRCTATDLIDEDDFIIRDAQRRNFMTTNTGVSYAYFDLVPNSTLFRRECLVDQNWDPEYRIGYEHLDFFLAHKRLGRWRFAVAPAAVIEHFPARSGEYSNAFRHNRDRLMYSQRYFFRKWSKARIIQGLPFHLERPGLQKRFVHTLLTLGVSPHAVNEIAGRFSLAIKT